MIEQRHGYIVNTASTAVFHVRGNVEWFQGLYAATKFGVVALSESLRATSPSTASASRSSRHRR